MKFETFSEKETFLLAQKIAQGAKKGDIYCLTGDLGSGKTQFSKGFAQGLQISPEIVTSPTFTIVQEYYDGIFPFFHFDLYRLKDLDELHQLGYEEYFFSNGICIIEWPEIAKEILPEYSKWVKITKDLTKDENYRLIEVL